MNKSYRSVWNEALGAWVAASELTKGRGKSGSSKALAGVLVTALLAGPAMAGALDGGTVAGAGQLAYGPGASTAAVPAGSNAIAIGDSVDVGVAGATDAIAIGTQLRNNAMSSILMGNNGVELDAASARSVVFSPEATGGTAGTKYSQPVTGSADSFVYVSSRSSNRITSSPGAVAIGGSVLNATDGVAIGTNSSTTYADGIALGSGSKTAATLAGLTATAAYNPSGTAVGTTAVGELSIGNAAGAKRRITNVAAGGADTDAVNVSQLKATDTNVSNLSTTVNTALNGGGIKYFHANSTLPDSLAAGAGSIAIGPNAMAFGAGSLALGANAQAHNTGDIYIGLGAGQGGENNRNRFHNIGVGTDAGVNSDGFESISLGTGAGSGVNGNNNLAIGEGAGANIAASNTVSIGAAATASQNDAIAIGTGAQANGTSSISIGTGNVVSGARSGAIGDPTYITGDDSYAIGNNNTINAAKAFVLGNNVTVAAGMDGAVGIGNDSTVTASTVASYNPGTGTVAGTAIGSNVVSVGAAGAERRLTNVAAGGALTDAVNVSQLQAAQAAATTHYYSVNDGGVQGGNYDNKGATGKNSLAAGVNASAVAGESTAVGYANTAQSHGTAVGNSNNATGNFTTALGSGNTAAGASSTAVGYNNNATGIFSLAVGNNNKATLGSVTLGVNNTGTNTNDVAVGVLNSINGANSTAVGLLNTVNGDGSSAIGRSNTVSTAKSFVLGSNVTNTLDNSVALGDKSAMLGALSTHTAGTTAYGSSTINGTTYTYAGGTPVGVVSVGADGAERRIQSVAAGLIGEKSTDAINGSQLYALTTKVDAKATHYFSVEASGSPSGNYDNEGATGTEALAAGRDARASGTFATAIGHDVEASNTEAVAIGSGVTASGYQSVAIGTASTASAEGALAIGNVATAGGEGSVAVGNSSYAGAKGSTALGVGAVAEFEDSVAIGRGAGYGGANSTLVGAGTSGAVNSAALGSGANAAMVGSVALGAESVADRAAGVAGYVPPPADATQAAAINATTGTRSAVSVGDAANGVFRQITGVAAGTADSDAVNVAQLRAVNGNAIAAASKWIIGSPTTYVAPTSSGTDSTAVGSGASVSGNNSVAVGTGATATTDNSVALGNGSTTGTAVATPSVTIRGETYNFAGATPAGVVSVGSAGQERQITNVAAGQISATSTDAINGSQLYATNQAINNIVVGGTGIKYFHANSAAADSQAAGAESVAIGPQAVSQGAGSIAVGNGSLATAANGVALGAGATADRGGMAGGQELFSNTAVASTQGAVSVGSAGNERQITNVAGGTQATDAVNVRQLQAVKNSSVQYQTNVDGSVDYNNVTLGNNTGPTAIHNVAPGVAGNDAVNVNQLNQASAASAAYTDSRVNQLRGDIKGAAKDASAGTAGAMAMAGMPQAYIPGKSMLAAGVAGYDGQAALAIGVSKLSDNGRWVVKFSGSANSRGKVGVSAGAGFHW